MPHEFILARQPQVAGGSSARDDQRARLDPLAVCLDRHVTVAGFKLRDLGIGKPRAEMRGLFLHFHDQVGTVDPAGKAGKIFHQSRRGELASRLPALEHKRLVAAACGVDGGGQTGAAGANDDNLLHAKVLVSRARLIARPRCRAIFASIRRRLVAVSR